MEDFARRRHLGAGDFGILREGVMPTAATRLTSIPWLLWTAVFAVAAVLITFASIARSIIRDSNKQELRHADTIIVFGAAEYYGRPSPVYKARLDHANDLFRQGLAPVVITTGGAAADPNFSEG